MSALEHAADLARAAELERQAIEREPPRLCPRCLLNGAFARMLVDHHCDDLDRVCVRCDRPLPVRVARVDERGSLSETDACGCYIARRAP